MHPKPYWVVLFLIVPISLASCGGADVAPEDRGLAGPVPIWTADAIGQPLAVPRTEVALNGHPVDVMIDTGASQHFVLTAAAWAYDVPSEPFGSLATDAHGARFIVRLAENGSMRIPGRPFHAPQYLFVFDSTPLSMSGVLGGLAPQLLAPEGYAAILDLRAGRLEVERISRLSGSDRGLHGRVCRAGDDPRDGWRYVVPVIIAGRTVAMLLDTGARATTLYSSSPAVRPILGALGNRSARIPREIGPVRVAAAASVSNLVFFGGTPFELGGTMIESDIAIGPGEQQCDEDGLLGFDLLRRCRIVLAHDDVALSCDPGEPELHRAPPRARDREPVVLQRIDATPACGRSAEELRPSTHVRLPLAFESAVDAYIALSGAIDAHVTSIEARCRDEGYLDARIREPVLERRGSDLAVRFNVEEGRRFVVGEVSVTLVAEDGARQLDADDLPWLRTRVGQPYRAVDVHDDARVLSDTLTARGVRVAQAAFGRAPHTRDGTVDVRFAVGLEGTLPTRGALQRPH